MPNCSSYFGNSHSIVIFFSKFTASELTRWVSGQTSPAQVSERMVNAKTGQPTNFTCASQGVPLSACLWERTSADGSTLALSFNAANSRPGQTPQQPGYSYIGDGLEKGLCGVNINSVKDSDNGTWMCTLISTTGTFYRGSVSLGILSKKNTKSINLVFRDFIFLIRRPKLTFVFWN
jgi:hypothetical protein